MEPLRARDDSCEEWRRRLVIPATSQSVSLDPVCMWTNARIAHRALQKKIYVVDFEMNSLHYFQNSMTSCPQRGVFHRWWNKNWIGRNRFLMAAYSNDRSFQWGHGWGQVVLLNWLLPTSWLQFCILCWLTGQCNQERKLWTTISRRSWKNWKCVSFSATKMSAGGRTLLPDNARWRRWCSSMSCVTEHSNMLSARPHTIHRDSIALSSWHSSDLDLTSDSIDGPAAFFLEETGEQG